MPAKVQMVRWGNSLAVRVPKHVAEEARLKEGDSLVLEVESQGRVVLKAAERLELSELLSQITPANLHGEEVWGEAGGAEVW